MVSWGVPKSPGPFCLRSERIQRGKLIGKGWFIRIGCLWGLQVGRGEGTTPQNLVDYSFIIKGKWGGGKDHLLPHSWVDITLPPSAPSHVEWGSFVFPNLSSQDCHSTMEKWFQSGLSTMVFHFEMSPLHKLLFLMCAENMLYGPLTHWTHWAGYGSHAPTVLLFGGMPHAGVAWFCC